jgi:hypothetical protein
MMMMMITVMIKDQKKMAQWRQGEKHRNTDNEEKISSEDCTVKKVEDWMSNFYLWKCKLTK